MKTYLHLKISSTAPLTVFAVPSQGIAKSRPDRMGVHFGASRAEVENQYREAAKAGDISVLVKAIATGQLKTKKGLVGILLRYVNLGAPNINAPDKEGKTALMWAVEKERLDFVKLLVAVQANLDLKDKTGETALMRAVKQNHTPIATVLAAKANLEIQDQYGFTPLMWAAKYGRPQLVEILVAAKANVNAQSKDGDTPLILAAELGRLQVVKILLDAKADKRIKNKAGETALSEAQAYRHHEVVDLLNHSFSVITINKDITS